MPFVPNSKVVQITCKYSWDSQQCVNTMYAEYGDAPTPGMLAGMAAYVGGIIQSHMMPLQSSTVEFVGVKVQRLGAPTDLVSDWFPLSPVHGGNLSPSMPNSVSLAIAFRTGISGRSNQGRNFWIGLCESQCTQNRVLADVVDDIIQQYSDLVINMYSATTAQMCVYSRYHNNEPRLLGLASTITSIVVTDYVVDSMRRRLPGRGR
jgi:hypothetical protein